MRASSAGARAAPPRAAHARSSAGARAARARARRAQQRGELVLGQVQARSRDVGLHLRGPPRFRVGVAARLLRRLC